jgi:hypothetical protein
MQSNAIVIKLLGQKIKDTLAFNQSSDVAQNSSSSYSSKLSNHVHSMHINHRAQAYTKQANKQATKNNTLIKEKL